MIGILQENVKLMNIGCLRAARCWTAYILREVEASHTLAKILEISHTYPLYYLVIYSINLILYHTANNGGNSVQGACMGSLSPLRGLIRPPVTVVCHSYLSPASVTCICNLCLSPVPVTCPRSPASRCSPGGSGRSPAAVFASHCEFG